MVRLMRGEEGQGIVEFALVLPPLLILLCGLIDFGFLFSARVAVTNAARNGARYATTYPTAWSNAGTAPINTIEGVIQGAGGTAAIPNTDIPGTSNCSSSGSPTGSGICITYLTASGTACGYYSASSGSFVAQTGYTQSTCVVAGSFIQVRVTYQYTMITPLIQQLFSGGVNLTSTATMVEEQ